MAVVPASVSSSKLYRFAPTRQLHADYEAVVPATIRDGNNTRVLREFLRLREEENVTGECDWLFKTCHKLTHWYKSIRYAFIGRGGEGVSSYSTFC